MLQDQAHSYRGAVVKQGVADVRRSHRLAVKRNAYEPQEEKLSIKSIFKVITVLVSASDNVEGEPRALRDKIWNP